MPARRACGSALSTSRLLTGTSTRIPRPQRRAQDFRRSRSLAARSTGIEPFPASPGRVGIGTVAAVADGTAGQRRGARSRGRRARHRAGARPGRPPGHRARAGRHPAAGRPRRRLLRGTVAARPRSATRTPSSPGCATCCATATPTCSPTCSRPGATEMRFADDAPGRRSPTASPARATTTWSPSPAGAPPSSGCCAEPCWPATGVELLDGVGGRRASSADADDADGPPRGRPGVAPSATGEPVELAADLVVAAIGRRSAVPRLARPTRRRARHEVEEDTGIVYLSRFYRLLDGAEPPDRTARSAATSATSSTPSSRATTAPSRSPSPCAPTTTSCAAGCSTPTRFDLAARQPAGHRARGSSPTCAEPITGVARHGRPAQPAASASSTTTASRSSSGFHAVGDAHTCTNPLYGRGCSLAMVQADAARRRRWPPTPTTRRPRSLAYEAASEREIEPWYRASVTQDRLNRAEAAVGPGPRTPDRRASGDEADGRRRRRVENGDFMRDLMRDGLMPAVRTDADVFRAFLRIVQPARPTRALMTDPEVIGRVLAGLPGRATSARPSRRSARPARDAGRAHGGLTT